MWCLNWWGFCYFIVSRTCNTKVGWIWPKFLLQKNGIQDGWLSSLRNGKHPNGFPPGSWDHWSLDSMEVSKPWPLFERCFFFMCSKWGLDHLRLWSLVLGPLNSFCASEAVATQLTKDEDKHHKRDSWFSMKQWPLELNASNKVPSIKQFEDQMVSGKVAEDMRIVCSFQELQCLEQMERLVLPSGVLQTREPLRCLRFCVCVCACSDLPLQVPIMLAKYSIIELTFDWRPNVPSYRMLRISQSRCKGYCSYFS